MDGQTPGLNEIQNRTAALKKAAVNFSLLFVIMIAVLLVSAGRINYWEAWAYTVMSLVVIISSRAYMLVKRPEMALERAEAGNKENVQPWDKILMPLSSLFLPLISWIVAGLDARFGWSPDLPNQIQWIALAVIFLGSMVGTWAMAANRFFSSHVRIQTERGHSVVSSGPYRFVRHPGYAGAILSWIAAPVFFSSYWVAIPTVAAIFVIVLRTKLEDSMLQAELPGYQEFSQKVKSRLLPGIW